jgi:hypothetical protein
MSWAVSFCHSYNVFNNDRNQMLRKDLKITDRKFEANGRTYLVSNVAESLTVGRHMEYEKMRFQYSYLGSTEENEAILKEVSQILNDVARGVGKRNILHAATLLQSQLERVNKSRTEGYSDSRIQYYLMLCTLFINLEGEDVTKWSMDNATDKINDWIVEGYAFSGFFLLVNDFLKDLMTELTINMEHG